MPWLAFLLKLIYWVLSALSALIRRLWHLLRVPPPPAFFRDWQDTLPMLPISLPPGPPTPPPFDPGEAIGTFIGAIMRVRVPREAVTPMLPRGVILPIEAAQAGYLHPVNLAFGFQRDVHPDGLGWLPASNYLEFVLGVPNLYLAEPHEGFRGPVSVLARLDLNRILPVILGRLLGLPKKLARIHTSEFSFRILSFLGDTLWVNGSFQPSGRIGQPGTFPDFADIIRTFAQPCASRTPDGDLVFSRYDWFWDLGIAQETGADITIDTGWGQGHYVHQGTVSEECPGAWRLRVPWTLQAYAKPKASAAAGS
jgi:hypothetical protein